MGAKDAAALEEIVRGRLKGLQHQLRVAHAGIVVSAAALRHQNVDRDVEIARVLSYCVAGRVYDQIERAAELLAFLEPGAGEAGEAGDGG